MPRLIGLSVYRLDINFPRKSRGDRIVGAGGHRRHAEHGHVALRLRHGRRHSHVIILVVMLAEYSSSHIRRWGGSAVMPGFSLVNDQPVWHRRHHAWSMGQLGRLARAGGPGSSTAGDIMNRKPHVECSVLDAPRQAGDMLSRGLAAGMVLSEPALAAALGHAQNIATLGTLLGIIFEKKIRGCR